MDRALRLTLADVPALRDDVTSSPFDSVRFDGNTDRRIVREALDRLALDPATHLVEAVLSAYLLALDDELVSAPFKALIGAAEAATTLSAHGGVGLGTGNIEVAAQKKLAAVGMAHLFGFGGYGSDAEDRGELLEIGAIRGAEKLGVPRRSCDVVVIGDSVRDITAARAIGARMVAVATGGTPASELEAHRPDALLASLADVAEVLRAVVGA